MNLAQLLFGCGGGLFMAYVFYSVWFMGIDTYADATWWLFPPLVFVSAMFSAYCLLVLIWRAAVALGLP